MKHLKRTLSLTLTLALALSLSAVGAFAASEPYYLTPEEASALYSIQINTDVDTEVFIDEADALTYYNPMWTNPRTNTGYYFVERDTTITVTYLDDNPAGDDIPITITLTPYRLQADGSYVSTLGEATFYEMWADGAPYTDIDYIYYCTDGNFHPLSEFADNSESAMQYGYGFAGYQSASLAPGDSATFTIPFDRFGDDADLMYEVQATLTYPQSDGSTRYSYRYARVILDEEAVAQMRAEQAGQTGTFTDVPADAWYAPYVDAAVEAGLMNGTGNGQFSPANTLSLAEVVTLTARLHAESSGSTVPASADGEAWYQGAYDYCVDNGLFTAEEVAASTLTNDATRFQMVDLLDRAVPESDKAPIHTDVTVPDLAEGAPYADVVYRWYQAGITQGDQDGNFNGNSPITRGETAAIFCRLAGLTERV